MVPLLSPLLPFASSAMLILKAFAACDDFDSEKQPPACAFPCVLCAPCVLCGEGFWLRLRRAAFQGLWFCFCFDCGSVVCFFLVPEDICKTGQMWAKCR